MKFRAFLFAFTGFALIPSGSSSAAPLVYGNYYDETAQVTCSSNSFCRLNFSQSPTDKLVMIRKLNCAVNSTNSLAEGYLYISTTNGGPQIQRNLPLPIPPAPLIGGTYWTNLESDIHWLMGKGKFPFVQFNNTASTVFSVICTITGDLVDPIP